MTEKDLKPGMKVIIDNDCIGYIDGIYPDGKGQYRGKLHAYVWVRTPSKDYGEVVISLYKPSYYKFTRNGRAVPFVDIPKRIQSAYKKDLTKFFYMI